jgi:hypothetical protein
MADWEDKKRWPLVLAAAAGAIIGSIAFVWLRWPDDAAPSPASTVAVVAATAPTTPVAARPLAPGGASLFSDAANGIHAPATDIALTDNQELIADSALRKVMDSYLLGRAGDKGLPALLIELNRRLPAAAARDAAQLATSYNAYLSAHDRLLAAQGFIGTPDLNRLIGWQQQRAQLRDRMLGEKVAHEWFGTEEAYLSQALEELRQQRDGTAQPMAAVDDDEARHAVHMRQVLRDAVIGVRP